MKPTVNEIEIAKKIVNNLIENDFFRAIICEDNDNFYRWHEDYEDYLKEEGIAAYCGETKACIISDELPNWVIKTGFVYYEDGLGDTTDYCAIEEGNYRDAVEEGLGEFFAATYKLCTLTPGRMVDYTLEGNVSFFIQEKAAPDESKTSSTCENYVRKNSEDYNEYEEYYYEDSDRLESLFEGHKMLPELLEFVENWSINDLHEGNFGYTSDGTPKIIDFSGYT